MEDKVDKAPGLLGSVEIGKKKKKKKKKTIWIFLLPRVDFSSPLSPWFHTQ